MLISQRSLVYCTSRLGSCSPRGLFAESFSLKVPIHICQRLLGCLFCWFPREALDVESDTITTHHHPPKMLVVRCSLREGLGCGCASVCLATCRFRLGSCSLSPEMRISWRSLACCTSSLGNCSPRGLCAGKKILMRCHGIVFSSRRYRDPRSMSWKNGSFLERRCFFLKCCDVRALPYHGIS